MSVVSSPLPTFDASQRQANDLSPTSDVGPHHYLVLSDLTSSAGCSHALSLAAVDITPGADDSVAGPCLASLISTAWQDHQQRTITLPLILTHPPAVS